MAVRAVRGATQLDVDDRQHLLDRVSELLSAMLERNHLDGEDVISMLLTATPDVTSEFPAVAARRIGLRGVPLMCACEMAVPGSLPRVIRVMAHVETSLTRTQVRHVYLHGAVALTTNLDQGDPRDATPDGAVISGPATPGETSGAARAQQPGVTG